MLDLSSIVKFYYAFYLVLFKTDYSSDYLLRQYQSGHYVLIVESVEVILVGLMSKKNDLYLAMNLLVYLKLIIFHPRKVIA